MVVDCTRRRCASSVCRCGYTFDELQAAAKKAAKKKVMLLLIQYTFELFFLKLPVCQTNVKDWSVAQIDSLMNHYLECSRFGDSFLVDDINSIIIEHATQEGWSPSALVWTSIALRTNTTPIMFANCKRTAELASEDGDYFWRTPYPYSREIRRVTVLPSWSGQ